MPEINNNIIPVMHCFDNNYVVPAGVAFLSMLQHANSDYFYKLYVLHTDITIENQNKLHQIVTAFTNASLEFINMDNRFDDLFAKTEVKGHYSKEIYYKFCAASLFPQYSKIIITDVDVVYLDDVSKEFVQFNINDDYYLAGHQGIIHKGSWLEQYRNSYKNNFSLEEIEKLQTDAGFWIFNLEKLRKDKLEQKFIDFAHQNSKRLLQPEQDVVNLLCYPKIKLLSANAVICTYYYDLLKTDKDFENVLNYDCDTIKAALQNPIQLHYATETKPWIDFSCTKAEVWFKYLVQTPFLRDILNKCEHKHFFDNKLFFKRKEKRKTCKFLNKLFFINISKVKNSQQQTQAAPLVSVLCCSYNQEKFIETALKNIVNQKTDFNYEVIVADDCSTDETPQIIAKYSQQYSQIKAILRDIHVGVGKNYYEALNKVQGKYLAICDGDDVWLDEHKLQKQIDFLETHQDYTICCSDVLWHYTDNSKEDCTFKIRQYLPKKLQNKQGLDFEDLLQYRFIPSCTTVMRWQMKENIPLWLEEHCVIDFPLTLIHAMMGKIKVFDEVLAQYNIHNKGVSRQEQEPFYQKKMGKILQYVNRYTDGYKDQEITNYIQSMRN